MLVWIYCSLATIYFIYFKDYLFFIRDTAYRSIIWNPTNLDELDFSEFDDFLEKNYNIVEIFISKLFFIFISPLFFIYVIFYIYKKLN
ncbi:MAG: hypothetical protein KatS3mg068_1771 [Candidatus Sericytochromatia bacterium]|nr:MAG: hypothetical protein KatS3mg068_1771 [Candidatus Sericytochromatia bacterium]